MGYLTLGFCRRGHRWARYGIDDNRGFAEFFPIDVPEEDEGDRDSGSLETVRELKERLEKYKGEKPFFIFINSLEPHLPYWPPQPFREKFLLKGVEEKRAKELAHLSTWEIRLKKRAVSPEDWEILKSLYDGETATLDNRIGVVFDYLKEKNLLDETLIIITSDHGDVQGEKGPYVLAHQLHIYDPALRVPLIVRYPESFPPGLKIKNITQTLDIFPTLMEILGIEDKEIWQQLQGFSLLPATKGKPKRDFALAECQPPLESFARMMHLDPDWDFRPYLKWLKAYYVQDHKYIWSSDGQDELYNIEEDPLESKNLLQQLPEKAKKMRKKLEEFLSSFTHHDLGDRIIPELEKESQILKKWGFFRPDFFKK